MATTKKISKSVGFSQSAADQALLEAIETALEHEQYSGFDALCKAALKQFFTSSKAKPAASGTEKLEKQVAELKQQLTKLETAIAKPDTQPFSRLEQQLTKLETAIAKPDTESFSRLEQQLETLEQQWEAAELAAKFTQLEEGLQTALQEVLSDRTSPILSQLQTQFSQLVAQVNTLEMRLQPVSAIVAQLERLEQSLLPQHDALLQSPQEVPAAQPQPEPQPEPMISAIPEVVRVPAVVATAVMEPDFDPVLRRLGALLEDF